MTRSSALAPAALAGLLLAIIGCQAGPSATVPLGSPAAAAAFELSAAWAPCHQMGTCVYSAELVGPDAVLATAHFEVHADGVARIGPGLPPTLRDGAFRLTLVSVMLGDTIEPNGEQTVLAEDARCSTEFTVGPGAARVAATGSFMPGFCTVSIAEAPNVVVAAGPDWSTLSIEGVRSDCTSIGGCAYVVQLVGPTGHWAADFIWSDTRVTPAAGLPHVLDPGEYLLAFESRLMSDAIVPGQEREYAVEGACRVPFGVGANPESIVVNVVFKSGACTASVEREPVP